MSLLPDTRTNFRVLLRETYGMPIEFPLLFHFAASGSSGGYKRLQVVELYEAAP
jgi:hypothetical protein